MPLISCPLCGSDVKVPREKSGPNVPLTCRKCHSPFHVNRSGMAVLGQPPDVEREVEELKRIAREKIHGFPLRKLAIAAGVVAAVGLVLAYVFKSADSLKPAAEEAARAFAANDLDALKAMAAPGTADDLARWYDEYHPGLVKMREQWAGKKESIEVGIAAEDPAARRGATAFSVHPGMGNARDISIASPGEATAGAIGAFDGSLAWTLGGGGHWRIDGGATYAKFHPPGSAPASSSLGSAQANGSATTR